jgi:hypothetical protein
MTFDEVVTIVGGSPGTYESIPRSYIGFGGPEWEWWAADDGILWVSFGPDDRADYITMQPTDESPSTWEAISYRARLIRFRLGW